jgi:outer membrane protein assembly factor BamE
MRKLIPLLIVLAGCKQVPMLPGISAYRIDIQQGNVVTQDMVAKLKLGMSKSQVRFALGTPLIVDPFHADRWDYIYLLQKGGRTVEQRRIIVVFDGDKLLRIDGDVVPLTAATPERAPEPAKNAGGETAPAETDGAAVPPAAGGTAIPDAAPEAPKP